IHMCRDHQMTGGTAAWLRRFACRAVGSAATRKRTEAGAAALPPLMLAPGSAPAAFDLRGARERRRADAPAAGLRAPAGRNRAAASCPASRGPDGAIP